MSDLKKNREYVNVQQAGKNELKKTLKQEALNKSLKAAYLAKKKGKKHVTREELNQTLK